MSNISDYKSLIDERLHERIFLLDNANRIYINPDFSGTIQQLFILKNWNILNKRISENELWLLLKLYEYRTANLYFDSNTGNLIGDTKSQDLYKKFYSNSLWLKDNNNNNNDGDKSEKRRQFSQLEILIIIIVITYILYLFFFKISKIQYKAFIPQNILDLLEISTREQEWTAINTK